MKYHTIAHAISNVPTLIGADHGSLPKRRAARNAAIKAGANTIGSAVDKLFRHRRGMVKVLAANPIKAPKRKPSGTLMMIEPVTFPETALPNASATPQSPPLTRVQNTIHSSRSVSR